ncbi:uncharacterized protein LOC143034567 isoform X2 [Oratosquilla oratoria]|uniref:uncharacterized protein LOC143034567 isoform X2 n=1 Tax=Oratosquilla oratoria TaxID=337810 RepID=UPI003F757DDC
MISDLKCQNIAVKEKNAFSNDGRPWMMKKQHRNGYSRLCSDGRQAPIYSSPISNMTDATPVNTTRSQ